MRTACLGLVLAALGAGSCVSSVGAAARGDLQRVPPEKLILVGTIRVSVYGRDQTERTTVEVTGGEGGFQLPASGDVLWVVDRPPGPSIRLTWLSTIDDALTFGDTGFELAPSNASEPCVYFGEVTIKMHARVLEPLAEGAIGVSFPQGQIVATDREPETVARLARVNPTLGKVTCRNALRRVR